ncbi:hypothetical protein F3K43_15095 [Streptomyces sp. LBUM 1476]|nr:hypothetical protein [Streptomyces sp. LBUM 1476]
MASPRAGAVRGRVAPGGSSCGASSAGSVREAAEEPSAGSPCAAPAGFGPEPVGLPPRAPVRRGMGASVEVSRERAGVLPREASEPSWGWAGVSPCEALEWVGLPPREAS